MKGGVKGGGGKQHSTGLCFYTIDISTHQLLVIALAQKLRTLLYVTNYFSQPGTLFDYAGWPF